MAPSAAPDPRTLEEVCRGVVPESEVATVQPREIGRLAGAPRHSGQVLGQQFAEQRAIVCQVRDEVLEPLPAMVHGRDVRAHRDVARRVDQIAGDSAQGRHRIRAGDDCAGLEPGEVPPLRR